MSKCMLGSAVIIMPFACQAMGYLAGSLMGVVFALYNLFGLTIFNRLCVASRQCHLENNSYIDVVSRGNLPLKKIACAVLFVQMTLLLIGYCQVIGDIGKNLIASFDSSADVSWVRIVVQVVTCTALYPFCLALSGSKPLDILNFLGLFGIFYVVFLSLIQSDPHSADVSAWPSSGLAVLEQLPLFIFAYFCCQSMVPCVTRIPMNINLIRDVDILCCAVCLVGCVVYIPSMVVQYMTIGNSLKGNNILLTMPKSAWHVRIGSVALSTAIYGCFVICVIVTRNTTASILGIDMCDRRKVTTPTGSTSSGAQMISDTQMISDASRRLSATRHRSKSFDGSGPDFPSVWTRVWQMERGALFQAGFPLIFILVCLVVGILVQDLKLVMSMCGILGGNTIGYVLPSVSYLKAVSDGSLKPDQCSKVYRWSVIGFLFTSLALYPICLAAIFASP